MPELGEVEYFRRQWHRACGETVREVAVHPRSRVFRDCPAARVREALTGARLEDSRSHGKQLLFAFSGGRWLGLHMGMTGSLSAYGGGADSPEVKLRENHIDVRGTDKHDHLVLTTGDHRLVFSDPRHFGRVDFFTGKELPEAWRRLPPEVGDDGFTVERMAAFLTRRGKSPVKAVLLMQEMFPGVGNWMADEILWRAGIHPARHAGTLDADEVRRLHRETRWVCRRALETIGVDWSQPPASWLFPHRWRDGGRCPRTGAALVRETIGGRTTCWSPGRQPAP